METSLKEKIIEVLSNIKDPEIPVNIWELGFIYSIDIQDNHDVVITMTLTAPNCPVAESLPNEIKEKVSAINGIGKVSINITFDPPWSAEKMSEAAKLELGLI